MTTTDPARILDIATGYMASKQLFEASRIGLFSALAEGPRTADELAEATGTSARMARILADAMASKKLLIRADHAYSLAPDAAAYLAGPSSSLDLAPFLTFLSEISYPHWLQFARTVDTTEPGDLGMNDERWATFMAGVMTYNSLHGQQFGRHVNLANATRALDFGGFTAAFAIAAMQANPALHTTFVLAPDFEGGISEALADAGYVERTRVLTGETATAEPAALTDGGFDAVFVNHVIHRFSAAENRAILKNVRAAASPGATLTLLDFFLDEDTDQRPLDALHAAEYLVIDGTVVYPEAEVREWLAEAGWEAGEVIALPGSPRVLIATAV